MLSLLNSYTALPRHGMKKPTERRRDYVFYYHKKFNFVLLSLLTFQVISLLFSVLSRRFA